ncbi:hypothetical protein L6452_40490 [Arctium lappa]|uniref:Uncharacterized protein n=1 Tax=Arctium lappa TaxID=4217 RepID=A0ACB8XM23_ARCLA|nr:hypothetical protein L6452_40490 [Arctium lappa]
MKQHRQSFLNTTKWIEEVRKERGSNVIIVLVGNKSDLVDKREVAVEEGDAKAREFGFIFIETSAKARFNIKPLFRKIVAALWGMETPSSTRQEDMVGVNSGNVSSSHVSSSDMSNTQEVAKTNDDNSSENEIKDEDVDDEEKDTKGKGRCECGRVYDDILRRVEEMHKRMEEMHNGMLKRMEEMHKGMLKRMEEMHKGMFRSIIKE